MSDGSCFELTGPPCTPIASSARARAHGTASTSRTLRASIHWRRRCPAEFGPCRDPSAFLRWERRCLAGARQRAPWSLSLLRASCVLAPDKTTNECISPRATTRHLGVVASGFPAFPLASNHRPAAARICSTAFLLEEFSFAGERRSSSGRYAEGFGEARARSPRSCLTPRSSPSAASAHVTPFRCPSYSSQKMTFIAESPFL